MKFTLILLVLLVLFWLALSGHYTGLLLALGAVSCVWVALIARRMGIVDHEGRPIQKVTPWIFIYYVWLAWAIVMSSLAVARMILFRNDQVQPAVVRLSAAGMSDLEKVIYANSITLTPGTLTIDVKGDWLTVHSLHRDLVEPLERGVMADRVRQIRLNGRREKRT